MDENTNAYVIDASYIATYLLIDEHNARVDHTFKRFRGGEIVLYSSELLPYEIGNTLRMALMRRRIAIKEARQLIEKFQKLHIEYEDSAMNEVLDMAVKRHISFYDASYLALATAKNLPLLTLDRELIQLV